MNQYSDTHWGRPHGENQKKTLEFQQKQQYNICLLACLLVCLFVILLNNVKHGCFYFLCICPSIHLQDMWRRKSTPEDQSLKKELELREDVQRQYTRVALPKFLQQNKKTKVVVSVDICGPIGFSIITILILGRFLEHCLLHRHIQLWKVLHLFLIAEVQNHARFGASRRHWNGCGSKEVHFPQRPKTKQLCLVKAGQL